MKMEIGSSASKGIPILNKSEYFYCNLLNLDKGPFYYVALVSRTGEFENLFYEAVSWQSLYSLPTDKHTKFGIGCLSRKLRHCAQSLKSCTSMHAHGSAVKEIKKVEFFLIVKPSIITK